MKLYNPTLHFITRDADGNEVKRTIESFGLTACEVEIRGPLTDEELGIPASVRSTSHPRGYTPPKLTKSQRKFAKAKTFAYDELAPFTAEQFRAAAAFRSRRAASTTKSIETEGAKPTPE